MKLPRNLSGAGLIRHLTGRWGYRRVHQVGSHVTLETNEPSRQRVVAPDHATLRIGTMAAMLNAVARHKGVSREDVLEGLR
jgi:predicted RNA binding protein YcfA (HicA-like mRNA interferase family)